MKALLFAFAAAATPKPIWQGKSGGYEVTWTESEIAAVSMKDKSALKIVGAADKKKDPPSDDDMSVEGSSDYRILSLVGPYVSLGRKLVSRFVGANETMVASEFSVVSLADKGDTVKLTQIFPEAEVLAALSADKIVKRAMKAGGQKTPFKSLDEMRKFLEDRSLASGIADPGDPGPYFAAGFLDGFVFHHVEGKKVAVRIQIPPRNRREKEPTQLGILLDTPTALRDALQLAQDQKAGFLGRDALKVSHGRVTFIEE